MRYSKMLGYLTIFLLLIFAVGGVSAATWTVDDSGGADFTTIQAAINVAGVGDVIEIAAGTYPERLNLLGKSLTINGAGSDLTIIDASSFTDNNYAIHNFGDNSAVRNLKLIGVGGTGNAKYGFKISHVENIILENIKVENSYNTGVDLNTVNGAVLNNIEVINTIWGFGLMLFESNNVVVTDVKTSGNVWGGVSVQTKNSPSDNIQFLGTFDAQEEVSFLVEQDPPGYAVITNLQAPSKFNYVVYGLRTADNYKQEFYQETSEDSTSFAQAILSSHSDVLIYNVTEDNYYVELGMSIQDAINAASNGDTINVAAGTYNENIVINKDNLIVKASNGIMPIINFINGWGVKITASNVTFDGFEVVGSAPISGVYGIATTQNYTVIKNNYVKNIYTGIQTQTGVMIGHNEILNNTIENAGFVGISLQNDENIVKNNEILGAVAEGFGVIDAENSIIKFNKIIVDENTPAFKVYDLDSNIQYNITYNYWGSATPDFGTLISGNVTTEPYLNLPPEEIPNTPEIAIQDDNGYTNNPIISFILTALGLDNLPDLFAYSLSGFDEQWTDWIEWGHSNEVNVENVNLTNSSIGGNNEDGDKTVYVKAKSYTDNENITTNNDAVVFDTETPIFEIESITGAYLSSPGIYFISPDNDGEYENIVIDLKYLEKVNDVRIWIENEFEEEIKVIYSSASVTNPEPKTWDGTNNSAQIVSGGVYYVKTNITDEAGNNNILIIATVFVNTQIMESFTNPETTNLSAVPNISAVQNFKLATNEGKIDFGSEILDLSEVIDLDNAVKIEGGVVAVDTSKYGALNKPATITLKGLTYSTVPKIFYNNGFTTKAGEITDECDFCEVIDYTPFPTTNGTLVFTVEHFTSFKVGGSGEIYDINSYPDLDICLNGNIGDLELDVKNPDEGDDFELGDTIKLDADVINSGIKKTVIVKTTLYSIDRDNELESSKSDSEKIDMGEEEPFELELKIPDDFDGSENYLVFVKAYEKDNEDSQCIQGLIGVDLNREKDDVRISNIESYSSKVYPDSVLELNIQLQNVGSSNQDVYIEVYNAELGISEKSEEFEIEKAGEKDEITKLVAVNIPEDIAEGNYTLGIKVVFDKNHDEKSYEFNVLSRTKILPLIQLDEKKTTVGGITGNTISQLDSESGILIVLIGLIIFVILLIILVSVVKSKRASKEEIKTNNLA